MRHVDSIASLNRALENAAYEGVTHEGLDSLWQFWQSAKASAPEHSQAIIEAKFETARNYLDRKWELTQTSQ